MFRHVWLIFTQNLWKRHFQIGVGIILLLEAPVDVARLADVHFLGRGFVDYGVDGDLALLARGTFGRIVTLRRQTLDLLILALELLFKVDDTRMLATFLVTSEMSFSLISTHALKHGSRHVFDTKASFESSNLMAR